MCDYARGVEKLLLTCEREKRKLQLIKQLPVNCSCGWKKKSLTKLEQKRMVDQAIKSGLSYQRSKGSKRYFAQCNFCEGVIEAQKKKKAVKNRNQVRF